MEDETGLELSLGLSVGDSSSKPKVKDAPSDPKAEQGNSSRLMGSLETQEPKQKQKSELITQENFLTDLAMSSTPVTHCSTDTRNNLAQITRCQEQLIPSDRTSETEEEKSGTGKRKLPFEDINVQNMQERLSDHAEDQGAKKSSIAPFLRSSNTEYLAESEGPQSRLVSQRDEIVKCSVTLNFTVKSVLSVSSGIRAQGLIQPCLSGRGSNPEYGRPTIGIPLSLRPQRFMNVPYPVPTMVHSTSTGSSFVGYPSRRAMPMPTRFMPIPSGQRPAGPIPSGQRPAGPIPSGQRPAGPIPSGQRPAGPIPSGQRPAGPTPFGQRPAGPIPFGQRPAGPIPFGQRPAAPTANPNSMQQAAFGYPSAPLPTLETVSSWAYNYPPLRMPSFTGRQPATGVQIRENCEADVRSPPPQGPTVHNIPGGPTFFSFGENSSDLVMGRTVGSTKHVIVTEPSVRSDDRGRPTNSTMPANEATRNPSTQGFFPLEEQPIRPGIAPTLTIGGCGMLPDLPWVTTTGPGPNGRTITGVTYAYKLNQFKIVCACHGFHLSPNGFRLHAWPVYPPPGSETNPNLTSSPPTNTSPRNPPQS